MGRKSKKNELARRGEGSVVEEEKKQKGKSVDVSREEPKEGMIAIEIGRRKKYHVGARQRLIDTKIAVTHFQTSFFPRLGSRYPSMQSE